MKIEKKTCHIKKISKTQSYVDIWGFENIMKTFCGGKIIANNNVSITFKSSRAYEIVGGKGSKKSVLMNITLFFWGQGDIFYNKKLVNFYKQFTFFVFGGRFMSIGIMTFKKMSNPLVIGQPFKDMR